MQINTDPSNQMCYIIEKVEPNAARIILCNSSSMQHLAVCNVMYGTQDAYDVVY